MELQSWTTSLLKVFFLIPLSPPPPLNLIRIVIHWLANQVFDPDLGHLHVTG